MKGKTIIIASICALAASGATATAGSLITGAKVKDASLTGRDIKDGSLACRDLSKGLRARVCNLPGGVTINAPKGDAGKDGTNGANGAAGASGASGVAGATGPAGPAGAQGQSGALPADFAFTNSSVRLTEAGVQFGRYGDAGAEGGSVRYDGLNGAKLSDIEQLAYTFRYTTSDGNPLGAPYLRVFLNDDTSDVVFDPTECATATPAEGTDTTYEVTAGDVRYDDDACDGVAPDQQPWSDVVAAHGDDVISGVYVTTGFSGGHDVRVLLSNLTVNGDSFTFPG